MNADHIEALQLEWLKNPRSQIFAPLALAYCQLKLYEEAQKTLTEGFKRHPESASGHYAQAKLFAATENWPKAEESFEKTCSLNPENINAWRGLAEAAIEQKKLATAVSAYKRVLTLYPQDPAAKEFLKKWEFLEAQDYPGDFQFTKTALQSPSKDAHHQARSLIDSQIVHGNLQEALLILKEAERMLGPHEHWTRRHRIIEKRFVELDKPAPESTERPEAKFLRKKRNKLERLLKNVRQQSNPN